MGLLDLFRVLAPPTPVQGDGVLRRSEEVSATAEALYALIEERRAAFTMAEARKLDAVIRAKSLLTGIAASFLPLAYRAGQAMPIQPRICSKPDPFHTRYEHVAMTVDSLIEDGCAFWRLASFEDGHPRNAYVIPHDEVSITNPTRGLIPRYEWRGQEMTLGRDLIHIAIGRRPGELHGRGPLREGLDRLATVLAAEEFARAFFTGGGTPPVVIKATQAGLTQEEATKAKAQWVAARSTGAEPAVFGKDWDLIFPQIDPQRSQMQEARGMGATITARILGIPGALLHVETSGATITYTNPAGAVEDLVKSTLAPQYLAPIEASWSELLPGGTAVRFDLNDMQRADFGARVAIYGQLVDMGVMTPPEVRAAEGWGPTETDTSHAFDPVPSEVLA